jgi:hypothetical protein
MAQLIPIELEDGTVIHIQAVEEVSSSPSGSVIPGSNAQGSEPKRGLFTTDPQKPGAKSFDPTFFRKGSPVHIRRIDGRGIAVRD